jgi:hypothetical protein
MSVIQNNTISTNSITEATSANGVSIDGLKVKDYSLMYGSNIGITINSNGYVLKPNQPAFRVSLDTHSPNAIGIYTVEFDDKTSGHLFDRGNNFDISSGNWKFTAPVSGVYWFSLNVRINGGSNYFRCLILKNNGYDQNTDLHSISGSSISTNYETMNVSGAINLSANDFVTAVVDSSADTTWAIHSESTFSGCLIG